MGWTVAFLTSNIYMYICICTSRENDCPIIIFSFLTLVSSGQIQDLNKKENLFNIII